MRILAIDQATTLSGVAVVDDTENHHNAMGLPLPGRLVYSGVVRTYANTDIERLLDMGAKLKKIAQDHMVGLIVIEGHTYATMKNKDSTEGLAASTFVCRFVAHQLKLPDPPRVYTSSAKSITADNVRAGKAEVRAGVLNFWGLPAGAAQDTNESDALAIAQAYIINPDAYWKHSKGRRRA